MTAATGWVVPPTARCKHCGEQALDTGSLVCGDCVQERGVWARKPPALDPLALRLLLTRHGDVVAVGRDREGNPRWEWIGWG